MPHNAFAVLHSATSTLVIDCRDRAPALIYWGRRLSNDTDYSNLSRLSKRQQAPASAEVEPKITLSPCQSEGFSGQPGLSVHRSGMDWGVFTSITKIEQDDTQLKIFSEDKNTHIQLTHYFSLDKKNDVLTAHTEIKNLSPNPLSVDRCSCPTFSIAERYQHIVGFEGRWSKEFQLHKTKRFAGTYLRENRKGRTSHDSFPAVILTTEEANERSGEILAFHLAWSGNHRISVEELHDGRALVQLGELLYPNEIVLEENASYRSPRLYSVYANDGSNGISRRFHQHVRENILRPTTKDKARPVHFNTWEALYFDHSKEKLFALVDAAADVGAERFVLDDGWFRGRKSDNAGLGDWFVDNDFYPEGLDPLIQLVKSRGMEFGLWFEPEMVNPDSDLFRQHPDWVLQIKSVPKITARQQLVLDLTREEVVNYLYERLHALLSHYDITYIKWDMNRDIHQPGDGQGRIAFHRQTQALYKLISKLRQQHPSIEIESCASGGGRADFGILAFTDRIWTSDSNDALDRLSIQKGFAIFFPPEVMGAHVGPHVCHITGRKITIETRISTAFFGHMGMEVNLLEMDEKERAVLKKGITLHKQFRHLLHSGETIRFHSSDYSDSFAVISQDSSTALYSYTDITGHTRSQARRFYFHGLEAQEHYTLEVIWPPDSDTLKSHCNGSYKGELLKEFGLQLPLIHPQTSIIFCVTKQ